jgi:hypothetical protein
VSHRTPIVRDTCACPRGLRERCGERAQRYSQLSSFTEKTSERALLLPEQAASDPQKIFRPMDLYHATFTPPVFHSAWHSVAIRSAARSISSSVECRPTLIRNVPSAKSGGTFVNTANRVSVCVATPAEPPLQTSRPL